MHKNTPFGRCELDPRERGALHLLAALKTRRNGFLGFWWRYNTWMGTLADGHSVVVLLGMYVTYRFATLGLGDLGYPRFASALSWLWLAFVVYTWIGPIVFQRALQRELATITIKPDF